MRYRISLWLRCCCGSSDLVVRDRGRLAQPMARISGDHLLLLLPVIGRGSFLIDLAEGDAVGAVAARLLLILLRADPPSRGMTLQGVLAREAAALLIRRVVITRSRAHQRARRRHFIDVLFLGCAEDDGG